MKNFLACLVCLLAVGFADASGRRSLRANVFVQPAAVVVAQPAFLVQQNVVAVPAVASVNVLRARAVRGRAFVPAFNFNFGRRGFRR